MATATPEKELTAAEAAKRVQRAVSHIKKDKGGNVIKDDSGNPLVEVTHVAVKPEELLAWKDYGTHVVVVTKDGHKLFSADEA